MESDFQVGLAEDFENHLLLQKSEKSLSLLFFVFLLSINTVSAQFVFLNTTVSYRAIQYGGEPLQFLGIPFGTANRWEYPVEIQQQGIIDATKKGASCPQICRNVAAFCPEAIDENCLNLNIWTPFRNINDTLTARLPVLVYIHGGSFENGAGSIGAFNGTFLASTLNAIIVTFNYRLSILGFPGHSIDSRLPLNPGILDQRLALSWIRTHIPSFGGDVTKMTLMGQSAGASSVLVHLAQEPTQAWFQRGIVFSLPAVPFQTASEGQEKFNGFVGYMNCTRTVTVDSKTCMNQYSMRAILDGYEQYQETRNQGKMRFDHWLQPVVDGFEIGLYPLDALERLANKDIIIGTLSNETSRIVEQIVPEMAPESGTVLLSNAVFGSQLRPLLETLYEWDSTSTRDTLRNMLGDFLFVCPNHRSSQIAAQETGCLSKICGDKACHTTDTVYFFNQAADARDEKVADGFRRRIRSFLVDGNPNVPDEQPWNAFAANSTSVLVIANDTRSVKHPRTTHCELWDSNGYVYQDTYEIPPSPTFDGIDSKWILAVLILFFTIHGFQSVLLIYSRFSRQVLFVNIKVLQETSSEFLATMGKILDVKPIPVRVFVKGLDFFAKTGQDKPKHILKNVNALFQPYSMTAVMGPSGSGKTTLLSLIASQVQDLFAAQSVMYNQKPLSKLSQDQIQTMIAFVAQHDAPYYGLTAREILMYQAMLTMPKDVNEDMLSKRVAYIIEIMGLSSCSDVVIHQAGTKPSISGGQRRRISIALALLKQPSVLILDEPTSGLDSQSSLEVIQVLSTLANQGYTILVTIHQPRQEIFELFTHTLILVSGQVFFHGSREETIDSFANLKSKMGIPSTSSNIADEILDTATMVSSSSNDWPVAKPVIQDTIEYPLEHTKKANKASLVDQFTIINARYWKLRPIARKFSMMGIATLTAVVLGLLQRREGSDIIALSLQIKGLSVACIGMAALKNISISFDYYDDRDFYNFDSLNGLVQPTAFFLHRLIYETAMATAESLISAALTFFILGCSPIESSMTTVIALVVLYYNCIVSLYTLIYSTRLGRPEARNISFFAQALLAVTSGVWIKKGDTLVYSFMSWMEFINPNYWTLAPLIRANLVSAGECLVSVSDSCRVKLGDLLVEQARLDHFSPNKAVQMLLIINAVLRLCQYLLLLRDSYFKPK